MGSRAGHRWSAEHLELHSALEKNETLKEERKVKHAQVGEEMLLGLQPVMVDMSRLKWMCVCLRM